MNSFNKEIGSYFELELAPRKELYPNAIKLNCARNALKYIIRAYEIKEIHIPFYTCPVVWQAARNEYCKIKFYHIDKEFMPLQEFKEDDFILYTNYFGICTKNAKILAKKYKNIIIDNAQSFYTKPIGLTSFNSARKFFGVPDGAYLHCDKKLSEKMQKNKSYERFSHLLKRIDVNIEFGYNDFYKNEDSLINEPIEVMSNLTQKILISIDYKTVKNKRIENFEQLHNALKSTNELNIDIYKNDVPMVYPYLLKKEGFREYLNKNRIYIDQYWQPLDSECIESYFQKYLLPLPIDQRYNTDDMKKILEVIKNG